MVMASAMVSTGLGVLRASSGLLKRTTALSSRNVDVHVNISQVCQYYQLEYLMNCSHKSYRYRISSSVWQAPERDEPPTRAESRILDPKITLRKTPAVCFLMCLVGLGALTGHHRHHRVRLRPDTLR